MRRAQAILVILALLLAPLALAAGAAPCQQVMCRLCAGFSHNKASGSHCPMRHDGCCSMSGQSQQLDFALLAQIPLAAPLPFFRLSAPEGNRFAELSATPSPSHGFFSPPFSPPRS